MPLVPYIGMDRPRALQGPAHTHDDSGTVWLEGRGADTVTLGQFFTLWGVRFHPRCLGATCGVVTVTAEAARSPTRARCDWPTWPLTCGSTRGRPSPSRREFAVRRAPFWQSGSP